MEVVVPVQDFHSKSACTSPHVSAPSSPKRAGDDPFDLFRHYTSAPTSPTRAAAVYAHFNALASPDGAAVPFDWKEKPRTRKPTGSPAEDEPEEEDVEFAFDFSGYLDKEGLPVLTTADELFEEGMIRPLKPSSRLQQCPAADDRSGAASSPRGLWSPGHRGRGRAREEDSVPFAAPARERGREKTPAPPSFSPSRSRKGSRSLSPLRGGGSFFKTIPNPPATTTSTAALKNANAGGGSKKWRLKDLLLFRSASEGRATGNRSKDPLRKYTLLSSAALNNKVDAKNLKSSSFTSTDTTRSTRRGSGHSAFSHEKHYAANRAASEEMKKKTALPYRQSLFGCLRFNPAVLSISRGFGGNSFSRHE
ncbi:hypothetical protein Cni_G04919 [Canna indica]|uniref:Uncharacterized protein n=1 Tax=Canna indica TaxID=4628 RepID=A0AAQ3JWA0_9LILI|nr:hypothetical protein Cni_G04919 [Canna indica]